MARIKDQIPSDDMIPFEERIEMIDWNKVNSLSTNTMDVFRSIQYFKVAFGKFDDLVAKSHFQLLLEPIRTYRTLSEVVRDAEANLCKSSYHLFKPLNAFKLFVNDRRDDIKDSMKTSGENSKFLHAASNIYRKLPGNVRTEYEHKALKLNKIVKKFSTELM